MIPPPPLQRALACSRVLFERDELARAIARMGADIDGALNGERALFLAVMNGALIFAGELALAISTDLEFDYAHATRYRGAERGGALRWLRKPQVLMAGRTVLLVDDILDEGHTLKAVRDACAELGARRVLVATLCSKRHARRVDGIVADFNGVEVPDAYVFGYGMDYHDQGRNLPRIYALNDGFKE